MTRCGEEGKEWCGGLPDSWFGKLGHGDFIHPDGEPICWKTGLGHEGGWERWGPVEYEGPLDNQLGMFQILGEKSGLEIKVCDSSAPN